MGDLTASPFTPDPKKTFSLPELMKKGLQDPIIVKDVATSMLSYIQPKIEEKIEETVPKAYGARFGLSNIYMTQDMCRNNQEIVDVLIKNKKAKTIAKYWTIDGKIYGTAHALSNSTWIYTCKLEDIDSMINQAINDGYDIEGPSDTGMGSRSMY